MDSIGIYGEAELQTANPDDVPGEKKKRVSQGKKKKE